MQISTKILNQQQIRHFDRLNGEIQDIQERVSTGQKILRASDDPVAAASLSVAKEQSKLLTQFQRNLDSAQTRLKMTDQTLQEAVNVLIRVSELGTMARNGALDGEGHLAIAAEMKQLKETMLSLANTTDATGIGVFSGFKGVGAPFEKGTNGEIKYIGSRGQNHVQISENMTMATNVDGGSAFMRVDTGGTRKDVFDIIDNAVKAVETASAVVPEASSNYAANLYFELSAKKQDWSFHLSGSNGSANINSSISEGGLDIMVDAINAASAETGVTATLNDDGKSIYLLDKMNGFIRVADLEVEGVSDAADEISSYVTFTGLDGEDNPIGRTLKLTDKDQLVSTSIGHVQEAIDNFSLQRAYLGAQISKSVTQSNVLGARKLAVERDVSRLGDADLAELVTNLQSQMTNLNAAQAAFAKIGQQSLFDYLR